MCTAIGEVVRLYGCTAVRQLYGNGDVRPLQKESLYNKMASADCSEVEDYASTDDGYR